MAEQTIVVLGGGVGGVVAASELQSRLKERARIVLVERNLQQSFPPSYLWVMTGERKPQAITRDISRLERKGIEVVAGELRSIDLSQKTVDVDGREIAYDALIVALGAELAPDAVPGLADAHSYYHLAGAERLRDVLATFESGRVALVVAGLPFKCPAAPYEGAMLLESYFHKRHVRHNVELALYTPEPAPMAVAGPDAGEAIQGMLAHKGIAYHPGRQLTAAEDGRLSFENGSPAPFDLLVAVPPHRAPQVVRDAGLTDDSGWIPVDQHTLETEHEGVFAIGDVTRITLPDGKPFPKAGVFAHGEAQVVAHNIAARILGLAKRERYEGTGYCFLEAGGGSAGLAQGDFFAHPRHITMRSPSPIWHWGKVAFERYWLWRWY
ncbi:MAG: NAD(P)/FAD-dependent oxidoreductase [Chloroflexi bacterium]|nr:NAD(P)/FAD-dependent oxidoreductase [Chloroflexota bacterium]